MWWDASSDDDNFVQQVLRRWTALFIEDRELFGIVHAIGSTIVHGRRCPLLLVDDTYSYFAPPRLWQLLLNADVPPWKEPLGRMRAHPWLVPFTKAPSDLRRRLGRWEVPDDSFVWFTPPPTSTAEAFRTGTLIRSHKSSTLGFGVTGTDAIRLTTAGHAVYSVPVPVFAERRRWAGLFRRSWRLGSVEVYNDPICGSGVDLALIAPANEIGVAPPGASLRAANPAEVAELAHATLHGGKSSRRLGFVAAPLNASRSLAGRIWINCWAIVERNRGFAAQGDSGGAVLLDNDQALGHLVAAYGRQRMGGIFQFGLVQDAETLLASSFLQGSSLFLPEITF